MDTCSWTDLDVDWTSEVSWEGGLLDSMTCLGYCLIKELILKAIHCLRDGKYRTRGLVLADIICIFIEVLVMLNMFC